MYVSLGITLNQANNFSYTQNTLIVYLFFS